MMRNYPRSNKCYLPFDVCEVANYFIISIEKFHFYFRYDFYKSESLSRLRNETFPVFNTTDFLVRRFFIMMSHEDGL